MCLYRKLNDVGDIVMSVANYRLREEILQMISQCSSHHNLNEGCSVGYAGLNQSELARVLYSTYQSYCGLNSVAFSPSTTIRQVIDFIVKKIPVDVQNGASASQRASYSYSETTGGSSKSSNHSASTSTSAVNMEKRKYEYAIGIDLGHGETSAAICPLQWDTPVEQLDPVKDLEMGGNKKVIPSAITILDNGNAYIGDSAFNPEILKQADVHVCFKKAPKDINGESEKLMMRFMQEVYRRIRENNSAMLTDGNHLVYIATPSGWDKSTQDLYLQMAKQAGLPMGGITKESRAAFVRAQHDVTSGLGKCIEKGAVVFDMGSSTLDFTYMASDSKLIDHGYDCGASFIEKTIFKNCEESSPAIRRFEEKYDRLTPYLLFEARKVKEQVYFDPTLKVKKTINFEDFIDDEDFEDDRFKMVFQPKELDTLLEEVGYIKEIEDATHDFVNNHIHNASIYGVFLTGGASRMDFIKPLVSKCWNIPESQIYRDQDPSLTISQGVAEVARMDLRTEGMDEGLENAIDRLTSSDAIYVCFSETLGNKLKENVTETVVNVLNLFKDDEDNWTLYGLQQVITQSVEDNVGTILTDAPQMLNESIDQTTREIRDKVTLIVANYSNQGVNVAIPQLAVDNIDITGINLDSVIESISKNIEIQSTNWLKYVLMGVGAIFGLIGIGIGYLAGKFLGQKELSEAEKRDKAMSKSLNRNERGQVYNAIDEKWGEIVGSINNAIDQSIAQNRKMYNTIKQTTDTMLEDYKKELRKARILID